MKKVVHLLLLFFGMFSFFRMSATPMAGSYTIDSSVAATATNFQNFYSANVYLVGGSRNDGGPNNFYPFGVSGSVVFHVFQRNYHEQFLLTGPIAGVSSINTITYDGGNGNASTRIISSYGVTSSPHVIINNVPFVTLRNLTIGNPLYWAMSSGGVQINGNSYCCRINKCSLIIGNGPGIQTIGTSTTSVDSLLIDSNYISTWDDGINLTATSANPCLQATIKNNIIISQYAYSINSIYQNGMKINNNVLNHVNLNYLNNNGANPTIISSNRVCYILLTNSNNSNGNKGYITNNNFSWGNAFNYCSVSNSNYWCIANNSFNNDTNSYYTGSIPLLSLSGTSSISVMNNIFAIKKIANSTFVINIPSVSLIDSLDYNIYYRQDTSNHQLLNLGGVYNTGNFIGASGFNSHSVFMNPGFVAWNDTHINPICKRGISLPYITIDFDGIVRNSPPNIGACELPLVINDMSTTKINTPTLPVYSGANSVSARFKNSGNNIVYTFYYSYQLNSSTPVTLLNVSTLNPCDTISLTFSTPVSINSAPGSLKVFCSTPNFVVDSNFSNDTCTLNFTSLLPVKLIDFSANKIENSVLLNWTTSSEINSDRFEIERSFDLTNWLKVGTVAASGNSNRTKNYQYNDASTGLSIPNLSTNQPINIFYRLKEIDKDGSFDYSKTISVSWNETNLNSVVVFPNPITGNENLFVRINSNTNAEVVIELTDITGKMIISKTQTISSNNNLMEIDVMNKLQQGIYFLKITDTNSVQLKIQKVVVIK